MAQKTTNKPKHIPLMVSPDRKSVINLNPRARQNLDKPKLLKSVLKSLDEKDTRAKLRLRDQTKGLGGRGIDKQSQAIKDMKRKVAKNG